MVFSKNLKDIKYQNLNYVQTGTRPDGRPFYAKKVATINDVMLLTNTDQGGQYSLSFKLDRPFRNGWFVERVVSLRPREVDHRRHVERRASELPASIRPATSTTRR